MRRQFLATVCTAALLAAPQFLPAQEAATTHNHAGHDHAAHQHAGHAADATTGPHGGTVQTVGDRRVETVIAEKGIMFMILGQNDQPIAPPDASGTLKLRVGESEKEYSYELKTLKNLAIGVGVDLSKVAYRQLHMNFQITNIGSGSANSSIKSHVSSSIIRSRQSAANLRIGSSIAAINLGLKAGAMAFFCFP